MVPCNNDRQNFKIFKFLVLEIFPTDISAISTVLVFTFSQYR